MADILEVWPIFFFFKALGTYKAQQKNNRPSEAVWPQAASLLPLSEHVFKASTFFFFGTDQPLAYCLFQREDLFESMCLRRP